MSDGSSLAIDEARAQIEQRYEEFSRQGFRTLGLAYKPMDNDTELDKTDEADMRFLGFLVFFDPPKADCTETIKQLRELGVTLKIITGDNHLVAATVAKQLGLAEHEILTGPEIRKMSDLALINKVTDVDLFTEVEPNQKERIIIALKKAGFVVGYMGDGINDVSALHAADVGISVDSAADVAKETAQIVLLEKDLGVLVQGVQGRTHYFCQYIEICLYGDQLQFRQHVQHGGRIVIFTLSAVITQTNSVDQFADRFPGNDHSHRIMLMLKWSHNPGAGILSLSVNS